jgi:hypothetical protein
MRGRPLTTATFEPIEETTFSLVEDDAIFEPVSEEGWTKSDLDELYQESSDEDRFLRGEVKHVTSSNVVSFQWLGFYEDGQVQNQLYVQYDDGSLYEYDGVNLSEALLFFRASSPGSMVWDHLRVRGSLWGYQKPYRIIQGNRLWKTNQASIARHHFIPPQGAPKGYHPLTAWKGAPGKMGQGGMNLSKKGGSRKVGAFTSTRVSQ